MRAMLHACHAAHTCGTGHIAKKAKGGTNNRTNEASRCHSAMGLILASNHSSDDTDDANDGTKPTDGHAKSGPDNGDVPRTSERLP